MIRDEEEIAPQRIDKDKYLIRVASAPESSWPNPYMELFYEAMSNHNIRLVGKCPSNDKLLRKNASRIDAIHLHWPEETFWRYAKKSRLGIIHGIIGFWRYLRIAQRCRIAVIWTVHNLEHHEGVNFADKIAYRLLAKYSDLLICHSQDAKEKIINLWHCTNKTILMYHGNYDGIYPKPVSKVSVIKKMGLNPDIPTVCCFGLIREYKGFELAVKAVKSMDIDLQLIIAGKPHPEYNVNSLSKLCEGSPMIRVILRSLSPQELADILNASDAVLLPYRKITGSGALMLAMTLGSGVIASDLPYFREILAENPDAAFLSKVGSEQALANAIKKYLTIPADRRRSAAKKIAQEYSWDRVVKPVASALRRCVLQKRHALG